MSIMKVFLFALFLALASAKKSYDGYQVWSIDMTEVDAMGKMQKIATHMQLDILTETKQRADVLVEPRHERVLRTLLLKHGLSHEISVQNLGTLIDEQEEKRSSPRVFGLETYNTYEENVIFMQGVADSNPMATMGSIGLSIEDKEQHYIKFASGATDKPIVYIDCGVHAREWVTQATCIWGINKFDTEYDSDDSVKQVLDNYDLVILPMTNPDGYIHTLTDRMWRKNRRVNEGSECFGVDLNRNFDDHHCGQGTSNLACSDVYCGPSPASEPETANVQNFFTSNNIKMMYSIHAYSQMWMFPYGYDEVNVTESDYLLLRANTDVGVAALEAVNGLTFTSGPIAETIYAAAGTTVDYAYTVAGITYSYTLELRPDGGVGFLLPEDQIEDAATETWAGLIAAINDVPIA